MNELYKLMVRRKGAEARVNLRKIRRWFDDAGDAPAEDKPADKGEKSDKSSDRVADKGKDKPADKGDKGDDKEWTLESAKAEIERLRKESESRRHKLRKYEKSEADANKAKDEEDDAKLLAEKNYEKLLAKREKQLQDAADKLNAANVERLREKIGRKYELPDDIVELLKGDNEEDIETHAKKLKPLFAKQGDQAQGGKKGGSTTPNPSGKPSTRSYDEIKGRIYGKGGDNNPFAR